MSNVQNEEVEANTNISRQEIVGNKIEKLRMVKEDQEVDKSMNTREEQATLEKIVSESPEMTLTELARYVKGRNTTPTTLMEKNNVGTGIKQNDNNKKTSFVKERLSRQREEATTSHVIDPGQVQNAFNKLICGTNLETSQKKLEIDKESPGELSESFEDEEDSAKEADFEDGESSEDSGDYASVDNEDKSEGNSEDSDENMESLI